MLLQTRAILPTNIQSIQLINGLDPWEIRQQAIADERAREFNELRIQKESEKNNSFWNIFRIVGNAVIAISSVVAAPFTGGLSLAGSIAADAAIAAVDIGFNIGVDIGQTGKVDPSSVALGTIGGITAAGSAFKAGKAKSAIEWGIGNLERRALGTGISESQASLVARQLGDVASGKSAETTLIELQRAGLTDKQVIYQMQLLREEMSRSGIKAQRFYDEIDFINQESQIWNTTWKTFRNAGIDVDNLLKGLSKQGIDVIGLKTQADFLNAARRSPEIASVLKGEGILSVAEESIGKSLEPSFAMQIINAQNIEKALRKTNSTIKLIQPSKLIKRLTDKLFEPIQHQIDKQIWDKIGKKAKQKIKHILRQDTARKYSTRNGVYPCFASSWINYLRAVPYGNGVFKCFVIFRKRGYQPVLITPPMSQKDIINWSESTSPGKIYHNFRKQYGLAKGISVSTGEFGTDLMAINSILGFIPNKYINLGTSLLGNVMTAYTVISTHQWSHYIDKELSKKLMEEGIDHIAESVGGRFGKAIAAQATGNEKAIRNYITGQATKIEKAHQSQALRHRRREQAKAKSLMKIGKISDKF